MTAGVRQGGRWLAVFLALGLAAGAVEELSAQMLTVKGRPPAVSLLCESPSAEAPSSADRDPAEAERLVSAATQAMILGDLGMAAEFLDQALQADPRAAEAIYLRGRIAADRDDLAAAVPWFCRYLRIAPDGASAAEARRRLDQALERGDGARLLAAFDGGVSRFESGDAAGAEQVFSDLIAERAVPEALYNRGLVRLSLGRPLEARADLRRYLELVPDAPDRARVEEALGAIEEDRPVRSAGTAFLLGAFIPGGGQYYTGRAGYGALVTGLVGGAVATGFLYERITLRCRAPDPDGGCPPDAIAGQETDRPLLGPALGVGAGLMLISAIEAALHARGRAAVLSVPVGEAGTSRFDLGVAPTVSGRSVEIRWLQLRH